VQAFLRQVLEHLAIEGGELRHLVLYHQTHQRWRLLCPLALGVLVQRQPAFENP
jgi:hypothetical protein